MTGETAGRGVGRVDASVPRVLLGTPAILRCALVELLFILTETGAWISVLVYAYARGGTLESGAIAIVQLVPAAALGPVVGRLVDRLGPSPVLVGGLLVQAAGMATTAVGVAADLVVLAYPAAVVAATAVVTTRPAVATLLPSLAREAIHLTAANVAVGWADSTGIVLAGLVTGVLLALGGAALALAALAALALAAAVLAATTSAPAPRRTGTRKAGHAPPPRVLRDPAARVLLSVLTGSWVVVGALDILFVVLALTVLDAGEAWVGYLQIGYGLGGVGASLVAVLLVGRRLGRPMLLSVTVLALALALTALAPGLATTVVLLTVVGAARALIDLCGKTLLQRTVPPHLLGRVFGLLEGASMAGLALGSLIVPLAAGLLGNTAALLAAAAVLPLTALVSGRALLGLDARASVPVVQISLLRSMRLFGGLAPPQMEGVARAMVREEVAAGTVLMREGERGDDYLVIADGEVAIARQGRSLGTRRRGDGVGEIALLRDVARTATVTAASDLTVYRLAREPFLVAVGAGDVVARDAATIVDERLRDEDPAYTDGQD